MERAETGKGFPRVRILPDNIDGREGVGIPPRSQGSRVMAGNSHILTV